MPRDTGSSEPQVLLYASNLHTGGGVAVASSVVAALAVMPSEAPNVTVLASSEVAGNVVRMGAPIAKFATFHEFNSYGLAGAVQRKPVRFRDFDVVLTIFGPLYAPVVGTTSIVGFAQPWVAYPDNAAYGLLEPRARARTRLKYEVVAGFFSTADALVVELGSVRDALRHRRAFRGKPIHVVPNVVDAVHFDPSRWRPVTIPPRIGNLRLGVVSRYYSHKNLEILPRVRRTLETRHGMEVEILVTLTEAEFASCSADFRDSVINVGPLQLDQSPSFNTQLDGIVLPTLLECFSATPIEALAVRRPLFASDRPFIRDTVGEHANYFDPLDPGSIADSIAGYFQLPPEERARREDAGYQHVASSEYTSADRAKALMEVVRQTVRGDSASG